MKELVTAFARQALPRLIEVQPQSEGTRGWLQLGAYQINSQSSSDRLRIDNVDLAEFVAYQKFDFARFAFSSYETMAFCTRDAQRPRAIGWPLLKAYYAAFFGAHALMRAVGQGVVRIDPHLAKRLTELGQIFGATGATFTSGTYYLRLSQNPSGGFEAELAKLPDSGGAHDAFWKSFKKFLEQFAADSVRNALPDSTKIVSQTSELTGALSSVGANEGTWLSVVRNQINYQHLHGVWFPFSDAGKDLRSVGATGYKSSAALRLDKDPRREPIPAFWATSLALAALSFDLAESLIAMSEAKSAVFTRNWRRLAS